MKKETGSPFIDQLLRLKRTGAIDQEQAQQMLGQWSTRGAEVFSAVTPEERQKKLNDMRAFERGSSIDRYLDILDEEQS